jgi:hypothetical protein
MKKVKMTIAQFMEFITKDALGATFSGLEYFVNESGSRQNKSYPIFDGKSHMLQKLTFLNATLNSNYQAKINRIMAECGIKFEWTPNKMTGRYYASYDKNRAIAFKDNLPETPENGQLVFICETHSRPKTQYFHLGQPIDHKDARTTEYFTPSSLSNDGSQAAKNSIANHALAAAAAQEAQGNLDLANEIRANANKLANHAEFQKLEFRFRTVKLTNLRKVNVKGMEITIEG